ncbi:MAG: ABC transporter substrate-binding protein [Synechococcales cyanobacterium RM1_1_8]|nr:ABC transporter substrate-binding protein [Synechococcales cyanobacterium RM1_1_8]NJR69362.1 ABC transporter substrate-binding protein [Synechococcales cyanobacterium CRU_2_2]
MPHHRSFRTIGAAIALLALAGCPGCRVSTQSEAETPSGASGEPSAPGDIAQQREGSECISNYDPSKDYFPNKITVTFAEGFSVTYHNHYKHVTVSQPWKDADTAFEYLLVQCGAPVPEGFPAAQVISVPVDSVVALSTTHLPHLDLLGEVDRLKGVSNFDQVNTPSVRAKIDRGELQSFYSGSSLDLERLVLAQPDLITTYGTGDGDRDTHPRLIQAGLSVAINAEYVERSVLGRAEWLKFTALFLNQEAKAEAAFGQISSQYQAMAALTQNLRDRPTVVTGFSHKGTWYMPGNDSYVAQYLRDAGASYLWRDLPGPGSNPLDFEAVFERAVGAEFWLNVSQDWQTTGDAIAADPRYGNFAALAQGRVFSPNARLNETGGNDYWESGVVQPHLVLADLIKIFHPDLLPDHGLVYYKPLPSERPPDPSLGASIGP